MNDPLLQTPISFQPAENQSDIKNKAIHIVPLACRNNIFTYHGPIGFTFDLPVTITIQRHSMEWLYLCQLLSVLLIRDTSGHLHSTTNPFDASYVAYGQRATTLLGS